MVYLNNNNNGEGFGIDKNAFKKVDANYWNWTRWKSQLKFQPFIPTLSIESEVKHAFIFKLVTTLEKGNFFFNSKKCIL
jgi:hypothetical protein